MFDLTGQTALVTGCKRGIGMAMAIALAEAGADIIGVSASLEETDSEIEKAVIALGRKFYSFQCNFNNREEIYNFVKKVTANHKEINILVNNAGTILRNPIIDHSDEYWDEVIAINQTAPFILSREIGKQMINNNKGGKIIFTASLLSFQGGITVPGYAASKGAIAQITKAFANEWASKGINVNAIVPGYISTDNTTALRADENRSRSILERIPAGRWGEPEDFKGAIVFLASKASNYIHGTLLNVDGGWMGR
jgi:2-dehydro-3-deoxy-D-gluconate 5-dehydrogenase